MKTNNFTFTHLTTLEQWAENEINEYKKQNPNKRITEKVKDWVNDGRSLTWGKSFSDNLRDIFENCHKTNEPILSIYNRFLDCHESAPIDNKYYIWVGMLYNCTRRVGNYSTGEYHYKNNPYFERIRQNLETKNFVRI